MALLAFQACCQRTTVGKDERPLEGLKLLLKSLIERSDVLNDVTTTAKPNDEHEVMTSTVQPELSEQTRECEGIPDEILMKLFYKRNRIVASDEHGNEYALCYNRNADIPFTVQKLHIQTENRT